MGHDNDAIRERMREVFGSDQMQALIDFIEEYAAEDFVEEYPQSGERFRGRDTIKEMNEQYEEATSTNPSMRLRSIRGSGDLAVIEATIDYGDGTPVSYVGVAELGDGKVRRLTDYFGNPFEAPAWRSQYAEKMEPAGAHR